jgi:hypothetical protein
MASQPALASAATGWNDVAVIAGAHRPPSSSLRLLFFSFLEYAGELRINVLTG